MKATHGRALSLLLACASCTERGGCGGPSGSSRADGASGASAASLQASVCRREVAHASVGVPPGGGAIDAVIPTCDEASRALVLWVLRGHTLSVLSRSLDPGSTFSPPREVSTGADQLGVLGALSSRGPAAWRSPTSGIDELDRDEWWAAALDPASPEGGTALHTARVARGSVRMPEGVVGLGVLAPWGPREANTGAVELLGTVAREGVEPSLVRVRVGLASPGGDAVSLESVPAPIAPGELKAFDAQGRVALVYAVNAQGNAELRALDLREDSPRIIGTHALSRRHVLVVARGVHRAGVSLFAATEFDLARPELGPCIRLDASMCVAPGPALLLAADPHQQGGGVLRVWRAGEAGGLVDALATDPHDGRAVLLTLGLRDANESGTHEPGTHTQRVTRVDPLQGNPETYTLALASELPPLDRPSLVECGGQLWLSAELSVRAPAEGAGARVEGDAGASGSGATSERAVLALPFACARRGGR